MVLRNPVYSACGVVLMLRGVGWCVHVLFCSVVLGCRYNLKHWTVVSGVPFLTGRVFERDIAHRRSVAVLCVCVRALYKMIKIRYETMYLLYGALPVPVRVTRGALSNIGILMHLLTVPLFSSQCTCETILLTLYSMVWDLLVSRAGPMLFYWPKLLYSILSSNYFPYLFIQSIGWYCGAGDFGLLGCRSLSPILALLTSYNNNNTKNTIHS